MATQKILKLSDYYVKNSQDANKNVVTNSEGKITTEDKPTNATTEKAGLMSSSDKAKLESLNNYTHPPYTPRTGLPLNSVEPKFGDIVNISQITSDETGHVTNATSKGIKIPNTLANGTTAGLSTNDFSSTYKTNIDNLTSTTGTTKNAHTHTKSQITDFPILKTVATSGSYDDLINKPPIPQPSTTNTDIQMNGTQSAGGTTTTKYAKADHVHPSDSSKLSINQGINYANMTLSTDASGKIITEQKNNHTHNYISTDNGAVGTNNLADNAVTNEKIATNAINSNNIINGTITNEDISSDTKISYSKLNGVAASDHEHNKWKLVYIKKITLAETNNYNYTIKISVNPELLLANFEMKCTDWKGDNSGTSHTFVGANSDFLDDSIIPKQDIIQVLNSTGTEILSFSGASATSNWRGRIVANSPSKTFLGFSTQILYKPNGTFTSLNELEEITEY